MLREGVGRAVPGVPKDLPDLTKWFRVATTGQVERSCGTARTRRPTKMFREWVGRAVPGVPKDLPAQPNWFRFAATR
jgi:hypothetical protein